MIKSQATTTEHSPQKRLWVLWMLFFFQYAAIGVYFTFLNVYYRSAGMSGSQIGLLNMSTSLVGMAGVVMWGYLSDRTGQPRLLIAAGAVGALLVAQLVPMAHTFAAFLGLGMLGTIMSSATSTLIDSTTLVMLGDRREDYGRYRLGGTIGYIVTTGTVGFAFDRLGLWLMFPAYGVTMALFAAIALLLPAMPVRREARARGEIGGMMRQPAWLLFIAVMFLCWIASNASINFLGVALSGMGANQSLIGIAVTIGAVVEIPFMAFSGWLIHRFGVVRLMLFAMLIMVLRYFLLGWMKAPEWAIAINTLNGIAFPIFWTCSVNYANKLAPPGLAGTAQGLLNSCSSMASVIGSLMNGWLFDNVGYSGLYTVMAFCVLVGFVLFAAGNLWQQRRARAIAAQAEGVPFTQDE